MKTMTRRFYKTNAPLEHNLGKLYSEAIEDARLDLARNTTRDSVAIVEVVAIVSREELPIKIEKIRK